MSVESGEWRVESGVLRVESVACGDFESEGIRRGPETKMTVQRKSIPSAIMR